jgi:hypothetical protein
LIRHDSRVFRTRRRAMVAANPACDALIKAYTNSEEFNKLTGE